MVQLSFNAETLEISSPVFQWGNIPLGMRQRRQWAISCLTPGSDGKPCKRPRRADGSLMEWKNPTQWLTYEQAISSGFPAIGFILTPADPYVVIDLDDPQGDSEIEQTQGAILGEFRSYSETSVSGRGTHIIVEGQIGGGARRPGVEIYDQDRYMICTGNVGPEGPVPVAQQQESLTKLIAMMGGVSIKQSLPPSEFSNISDDHLIARMEIARNGERFKQLFYGPVEKNSDNDAALFALMTFYTRDHDQLMRLFARSALYRPRGELDGKKGHTEQTYHDEYLVKTMGTALRLRSVPWADVEHGKKLAENLMAKQTQGAQAPGPDRGAIEWPPGLVGEIAQYIYRGAPRPIKEVAIAGALAAMAGVCGRQFTVSGGQGLNLYIALLAASGMGKEAAKNGVDRLFYTLGKTVPGATVYLGPRVVSGPALEKAVAEHNPCFVTFVSELGVRLQNMLATRGGDPMMKAAWLGLYSAAVQGGRHQGAFHSKKDDRTDDVVFPAVSIFGESTHSAFYKAIEGKDFEDGLIPRFLIVSHSGTEIPALNPDRNSYPDPALVDRFGAVAGYAMDLQARNQFLEVEFGEGVDPIAIDRFFADKASKKPEGAVRLSWTRATMQMFKVAALLAVGENHFRPVILPHHMDWAANLVEASVAEIEAKDEDGSFDTEEARRLPILMKAVKEYLELPDESKLKTYKVPKGLLGTGMIPFTYFRRRAKNWSAFKSERRDLTATLEAVLRDACQLDMLTQVSAEQVKEHWPESRGGAVYMLGEAYET